MSMGMDVEILLILPKNAAAQIFPKKGEVGKIVARVCYGRVTYDCCLSVFFQIQEELQRKVQE